MLLAYREGWHMHDELWAGVGLKLDHAVFHFVKMGRAIEPPELTAWSVTHLHQGATIGTGWQRAIYAHFDAFLSAFRSIPWVIEACFGADVHPNLEDWWKHDLDATERRRRLKFSREFGKTKAHKDFLKLLLIKARNTSVHQTGYAPVKVKISGIFGVVHTGSPVERVPDAETRGILPGDTPSPNWVPRQPHMPVQPREDDFTIKGRPLFRECQGCLDSAGKLIGEARAISAWVHGSARLKLPHAR